MTQVSRTKTSAFQRLFRGILALVVVTSMGVTNIRPAEAAIGDITPIIECVAENTAGSLTAYFGYRNTNASELTVPHGFMSNHLYAMPSGAMVSGQSPTTFLPGRTPEYPGNPAFSVTFTGGMVVWMVQGATAWAFANPALTPRCSPLGDVAPPTLSNTGIYNPSIWGMGYNILGNPNHLSDSTGKPVIGGTVAAGATFEDNETLTNVLGGVSGQGFFSDGDWTPFPTNNNSWNPVPQGPYHATWNTKTGAGWQAQPDGDYTIFLNARDKGMPSGTTFLQQNDYEYIDVTVDNTAPTASFVGATPAVDAVLTGTITVDALFADVNGLMNTHIGVHAIANVCSTSWPVSGSQSCVINTALFPDGPQMLVASAVDKAGNNVWISRNVVFDNAGPSIPMLLSPANNSYLKSNPAQFMDWTDSADAYSNPVSYEYRLSLSPDVDGNGMLSNYYWGTTTAVSQHIGASAPGVYYWQVRSMDTASNYSAWTTPWKVTIDDQAPSLPVHLSPANNTFTTTANQVGIDWTEATDNTDGAVMYYYQSSLNPATNPDGSFVSPAYTSGALATSYIPTPGTPEGTYYWHVRAVDAAGNSTAWTSPWVITVDNTAPTAPDPLLPVDGVIMQGVAFTQTWETISDAVQYRYQSCNVDPGDVGAPCSSVRFTALYNTPSKFVGAGQPNSHFWWRAQAKDAAGNWSPYGEAFEFIIDNSAPTIVLDAAPALTNDATPTITGTAEDVYLAGLNRVEYRIVDVSGMVKVVIYDWATADLNLSDGTFSFTPPIDLPDSRYAFQAIAIDNAGNTSEMAALEMTIDTTAPEVPILTAPEDGYVSGGASFAQTWEVPGESEAVDASTDAVLFRYQACASDPGDAGEACPEGDELLVEELIEKTRTFPAQTEDAQFWWRVQAKDSAENWSDYSESFEVIVDLSAPVVTLVSLNGTETTDTTPSFSGTAADVYLSGLDSVEFRVLTSADVLVTDWAPLTLTGDAFSFTTDALALGSYRVEVRAEDAAGNQGGASTEIAIVAAPVPVTPPTPPTPPLDGVGGAIPDDGDDAPAPAAGPVALADDGVAADDAAIAAAAPTPSPSGSPSPSASPSEDGDVAGVETGGSGWSIYWWLLLIPVAYFFWLLAKRRREEQE